MGYYTYYTMDARDAKTNESLSREMEAKICQRLWEISDDAIYNGDTFDECFDSDLKWYDHTEDMIKLSKEFPDVVFLLEGVGEDREDNWRLYVHNGEWEMVQAMIVWNAPGCEKFRLMGY